jgi:hypothetical protein
MVRPNKPNKIKARSPLRDPPRAIAPLFLLLNSFNQKRDRLSFGEINRVSFMDISSYL